MNDVQEAVGEFLRHMQGTGALDEAIDRIGEIIADRLCERDQYKAQRDDLLWALKRAYVHLRIAVPCPPLEDFNLIETAIAKAEGS